MNKVDFKGIVRDSQAAWIQIGNPKQDLLLSVWASSGFTINEIPPPDPFQLFVESELEKINNSEYKDANPERTLYAENEVLLSD